MREFVTADTGRAPTPGAFDPDSGCSLMSLSCWVYMLCNRYVAFEALHVEMTALRA
jgi:hypothetical protein